MLDRGGCRGRRGVLGGGAYATDERDPLGPYQILVPPAGNDGVSVLVQAVPESKAGKNRMHIDIHVGDPDREVDRLVKLGATGDRPW